MESAAGFPGETQEDYEQQLVLIKQLLISPPPRGIPHLAATVQSQLHPGDDDGLR